MSLKVVCSIQKEPTPHRVVALICKSQFSSFRRHFPKQKIEGKEKIVSKKSILTLPENFTFPKAKVKHRDLPSCFSPPFCAITCDS